MQESTFKPSVDYQPHSDLETDVTEFLEGLGFAVHQSTYHSIMPKELVRIIQNRFTPTCLYVRGRADRLAIHKVEPIDFEWEAKTHANPKYGDLTIELQPLLHHISKSRLGVQCLYVFRVNNKDGGFWVNNIPPMRCAWFPPRVEYNASKDLWMKATKELFPGLKIVETPVNGSGDPFVIINQSDISNIQDWRELILELL